MNNIEKLKKTPKDIFDFEGSMVENMKLAEMMAFSDLVPKDYKKNPGNVLVAVQMGFEVGLKPMQALQNIAVINGRPCIWGDALIGICRAWPICEYIKESFNEETMTAKCTAKRKDNDDSYSVTFSKEDAITAQLWIKMGPWKQYPKRMLQMRARGFCLRDLFPDALKGLQISEEVLDYQNIKQVNDAPIETAKTSKISSIVNAEFVEPDSINVFLDDINKAENIKELHAISGKLSQASDSDLPQLRAAWAARKAEIDGNPLKPIE